MDWFKKSWVLIVGFICLIIGTILLYLGGTGVVDIDSAISMTIAIVDTIGVLIIFIKKIIDGNKK